MSDLLTSRTVRFILVHGTWGRGIFSKWWIEPRTEDSDDAATPVTSSKRLRWFDHGSDFRRELTDALKSRQLSFTTRVFLWDGANSIVSRNKASASLAREIERLAAEHPDDPIVIVAHSHGGNVALRAAHIAAEPSVKNLRVTTLATPFLQIRTYTSFDDDDGALGVAFDIPYSKDVISSLLESVVILLMIPSLILTNVGPNWNSWSLFDWLCVGGLLGLHCAIAMRVVKLVVNPYPTYKWYWGRDDSSPKGWAYKPDRLASLSYYSVPQRQKDWLLVLRGIDDEASLSLAAGAIGNRITHLFLGRILPSLVVMLNLAFFIGFFWFWSRPIDSFYLSQLSQIVLVLICIIETVVLFLPGCFRSVFGRELLLGCWRCEIFAYSAPDTALGVRVKTFLRADSGRFGLRHAIYKNPEIAPYIAAWLTASVKGKNELID